MSHKTIHAALMSFLIVILLAACQGETEVAELPTLAVLPSLTPSDTPTPTPEASATPTSTPTDTPTFTPTATSTLTSTPSVTPTFTLTPTVTLTPTATATATSTVTNTPVPTLTPIPSDTPVAPQILSFTASATNVAANSSITLSWNTLADGARIDQLNAQGQVVQTFTVVPIGSLPVTVPSNAGRLVIYRLTAIRNTLTATFSIPITVQCVTPWFFGNEFAPQNSGCPTGGQSSGAGAFQQFERGFMIYVNANNLNTIFGAQNQDSRYISYTNGWDGSTTYSCFGTPPGSLIAPLNQFGWAYCNTNAPVGGWSSEIGWGVTTIDTNNRTIQYEDTGAFYIDSPIGVFRFGGVSNLTWQKIK